MPAPSSTPVPSPCVNVCEIDDDSGLCRGCLRTLDEIAGWMSFSADEKRAVWRELDARRAARAGRDEADAER